MDPDGNFYLKNNYITLKRGCQLFFVIDNFYRVKIVEMR